MSIRSCLAALGVVLLVIGGSTHSHGQALERIAGVVNNDVISLSDIRDRLLLTIVVSGLPRNQESADRLQPQVMRQLIDERLQFQEAERLGIEISDDEVADAFERVAGQNNLPPETFAAALRERGASPRALEQQLRAQIAWRTVIRRQIAPTVVIGDDEVDDELARIQANAGLTEYRVAEIFLPVETPQDEPRVQQLSERLSNQIRQGAPFPAVARQFSQGIGAADGGVLGWVQQGQLAPELDTTLASMNVGQLSEPVRTLLGYHILFLADRREVAAGDPRETIVDLKQVLLPLSSATSQSQRQSAGRALGTMGAAVASCDGVDQAASTVPGASTRDLSDVRVGDLPNAFQRLALQLPIGRSSDVLQAPDGLLLLVVCRRTNPGLALPDRTEIQTRLGDERVALLQRRLLRDLRNAAFIDIRI